MEESLGYLDLPGGLQKKICCSSWGFRGMDYEVFFFAASKLGFDNVEVEVQKNAQSIYHIGTSASRDEINDITKKAKDSGIEIAVISGTNDFTTGDLVEQVNEITLAKKQVDLAASLGADVLRLFGGWKGYSELNHGIMKNVVDAFIEVGDYADSQKIKIAIENHGGITGTAAQMNSLLLKIKQSNVGCTYDPANYMYVNEDPIAAFELLGDTVFHIHLKDIYWEDSIPTYTSIGKGKLNWQMLLPIIFGKGYSGYVGIEYESANNVMQGTRNSLEFIKKLVGDTAWS